jgi:hypothetical protein
MPISHLTRESVLLALAEFDDLGRAAFLAKYGFGDARSYFLVHDGRRYDSKPIAGAAHGYLPGARPLGASEFSGGERTVKAKLTELGFTVEGPPRNPPWSRDELILALDLYFRHRPDQVSKSHSEVIKLSEVLNSLPHQGEHPDAERFRNPNGVYMKLCNFLRFDPEYSGKGLESGGKAEEDLWTEFSGDRRRLAEAAAGIVAGQVAGGAATHAGRGQRYWALFANPRVYRIDEALRSATDDTWVTSGKDIRRGDRVLIWRGLGRDGRRGVVAFGEITSDPESVDDSQNPFWVKAQEPKSDPRVHVHYFVPSGLPLWLAEHPDTLDRLSVARARGGTVFSISSDDWGRVIALAGGWPGAPITPRPKAVGEVYTNVGRVPRAAPRNPFDVDPDTVDRGNQGHATTVDALADHLRAIGITPLAPSPDDPAFDLAWKRDQTYFVAEIKSVTDGNEEKQLRLGLGQVLRYRHQLSSEGRTVVAVLVAEREPNDKSWGPTCAGLSVYLVWPGAFGTL